MINSCAICAQGGAAQEAVSECLAQHRNRLQDTRGRVSDDGRGTSLARTATLQWHAEQSTKLEVSPVPPPPPPPPGCSLLTRDSCSLVLSCRGFLKL